MPNVDMAEAIEDSYADCERQALLEAGELAEGRGASESDPEADRRLCQEWAKLREDTKRYVPSRTLALLHAAEHKLRVVQGPVGCLAGECRIWTERGLERMDELYRRGKPFRVWTLCSDRRARLEGATAPFIKGSDRLYEVTLNGGFVFRAAGDHLVQKYDDEGWIKVSDLGAGERLLGGLPFLVVSAVRRGGRSDRYYDLSVPSTGNYIGEWGVVHHNSGKTHGCEVDIPMRCNTQSPARDGNIYNRCLMARGTHQELKETTFNMWMHLFPRTKIALSSPIHGTLKMRLGNRMSYLELLGFGMDTQNVEAKLRSNDFSIGFANEVQYISYKAIEIFQERIGRYPYSDMVPRGVPVLNYFKNLGLTADTNAPVEGSWLYERAQVVKDPEELYLFQPPAMFRTWDPIKKVWTYEENRGQRWESHGIAAAENIENLNEGWTYYWDKINKSDDYVRRNVLNEYGSILSGKPVFPEFRKAWHVPAGGVPMPKGPRNRLYCGMDLGRHPRAVFGYYAENGGVRIPLILARDCGVEMFARTVMRPVLASKGVYPSQVTIFPDPAGLHPGEQIEATSIEILRAAGFDVTLPVLKNNDPFTRIETVRQALTRTANDGDPYVTIDPGCEELIRALNGGYPYQVSRGPSGTERIYDKPDKNSPYSHIADALQYLMVGLKYGRREDRLFGADGGAASLEWALVASDARSREMFC